jgi:pilus assembly protein Flp/PilA
MAQLYVMLLSFVSTATDRVRKNDEGATAVEYGLMVALIAAGIVVAVMALRDQLNSTFDFVTSQLP